MPTSDLTSNATAFAAMGWPSGHGAEQQGPDTDDGAGVTIAVADWGFDALHPSLRHDDGRSRLAALVDQNQERTLSAGRLDAAIAAAEAAGDRAPLDALYDPHAHYYDRSDGAYGAHGTAMASIAAGSRRGAFAGLAPAADLIAIQLAHLDPTWKEADADGQPTWATWSPAAEPVWSGWRNYLDSPAIIAGLECAWQRAAERQDAALVVTLAVGSWAGPHDGRTPVERKIAEIAGRSAQQGGPVTAIVLTAGNAASENGHFAGTAAPDRPAEFDWLMWPADPTANKIEIWYAGPALLAVTLAGPGGEPIVTIAPGATAAIVVGGRLVGIGDHVPAASGDLTRVRLTLHPPYFPGGLARTPDGRLAWCIRCVAPAGAAPVAIHAWVERDDGELERSSVAPHDTRSTVSGIAAAPGAVVVAAFDHLDPFAPWRDDPLSGRGPLPWTTGTTAAVPHVAAPGHRIVAARSKTGGYTRVSGSSPAGAFAAGALAVVMGRALKAAGRDLGRRRALLRRAIAAVSRGRDAAWSPSRGHGAVDIAAAVREVTQ